MFSNICYYSGAKEVTVTVGATAGGTEGSREREGREIMLYIEDDGVPYNPLERPDPDITLPAELRKEGGLGIYLVKKLMDHAEYGHSVGKNKLRLVKKEDYYENHTSK